MKAILFDVDDTLYDQVEPFKKAYDTLFEGRFDLEIEKLFAARHRRSDEIFEPWQRGEVSAEEMYIYRGQKAFEDLGCFITDEEALRFQELYAQNQKYISISDTIRSLLTVLHQRKIPLGIITNGPSEHQRKKIRVLGLDAWIPDKFVTVSGDCGISKPERGIFDAAREKFGLPADQMYFVGDSWKNDIVGAAQAGWHTVWLNRRKQPAKHLFPAPEDTVQDEEGLRALLLEKTAGTEEAKDSGGIRFV